MFSNDLRRRFLNYVLNYWILILGFHSFVRSPHGPHGPSLPDTIASERLLRRGLSRLSLLPRKDSSRSRNRILNENGAGPRIHLLPMSDLEVMSSDCCFPSPELSSIEGSERWPLKICKKCSSRQEDSVKIFVMIIEQAVIKTFILKSWDPSIESRVRRRLRFHLSRVSTESIEAEAFYAFPIHSTYPFDRSIFLDPKTVETNIFGCRMFTDIMTRQHWPTSYA